MHEWTLERHELSVIPPIRIVPMCTGPLAVVRRTGDSFWRASSWIRTQCFPKTTLGSLDSFNVVLAS